LLEKFKRIILIGESSGAVLALATLLRAKEAGFPQPLLCVLISPVVDYGFKDASLWQRKDAFAHPRFVVEMHRHYVAGKEATLPDLSPVDADLTGIAPLFVLAGENEIMRGEVDRLVKTAHRGNVPMETSLWPNAWHSWHALAPQLPEATQALETLGRAIQSRVLEGMG
jgi:acetyl esterase/lipase